MAGPWVEIGITMVLAGALSFAATLPPATITPTDAEAHEGRRVTMVGVVEDLRVGTNSIRGVLVLDGHGVHFERTGTEEPPTESLVRWSGDLVRIHGRLTLLVDDDPWN